MIDVYIDGRNGEINGINCIMPEGLQRLYDMLGQIIDEVSLYGTSGLVIVRHGETHRFTIVPEDPARG